MSERLIFPALVVAGLLGLGGLALSQRRAPERLRARAAETGMWVTDLAVREMG
jgi:hypothetical protein